MKILGISAYYHDSAAALLNNGDIVAAAQEERFTRKKHDFRFPSQAIQYCLFEAGISLEEIDYIAFYDKPLIKFERLLSTYLAEAPRGLRSFLMSMPIWLKEKLYLKEILIKEFQQLSPRLNKKVLAQRLLFSEHHQSHAASAFFPSPFKEAAILTVDGVGEWTTTSLAHGRENSIQFLEEIKFPHSIGLLYSAFTFYTGFKVNSGEYKVMGLAPYGEPKYVDLIKEHLVDIKSDGSFRLNMEYFNFAAGLTMTSDKFHRLFGGPPRKPESPMDQRIMDLARSVQDVTEEMMLGLARHARQKTGAKNLCLAGGVALNCVANGKIIDQNIFEKVWIQPAAGDAGGALGAALSAYHQELGHRRELAFETDDNMKGSYLGPRAKPDEIRSYLESTGAVFHELNSDDELIDRVVQALESEQVVGWHQGRMEFGPRALGGRSIIGDARSPKMQSIMNLKIKYRESFRPFAPSVLRENVADYFECDIDSPYMLVVAPVKEEKRVPMSDEQKKLFGIEKLNIVRSEIPAVTHIDYSARIQTVHKNTNPKYHKLISKFFERTKCPVIINTSFNVRGEPIVCSPKDSFTCFMRTEMDVLVIENFILYKKEQKLEKFSDSWKQQFELD